MAASAVLFLCIGLFLIGGVGVQGIRQSFDFNPASVLESLSVAILAYSAPVKAVTASHANAAAHTLEEASLAAAINGSFAALHTSR